MRKKDKKQEMRDQVLKEFLHQVKEMEENVDFVIHVECRKEPGINVKIEGTRADLKGGLAALADSLNQNSNLTADDIREAIETGLRGEDAAKEDVKRELTKFFNELFEE